MYYTNSGPKRKLLSSGYMTTLLHLCVEVVYMNNQY